MDENSTSKPDKPKKWLIFRLWHWFWTPAVGASAGFIVLSGFLGGIVFWGGFHWTLEATNTEAFCTGCHSMETNLGEYRQTIHYNNHSGVRAICSDCHVPKEWQHKIKAKVMAVKDIYHELVGSIDTAEKYEGHRLEMAAMTWRKMKQSDSRECRNCHNFDYMDFTIQETRAASEHQRAIDNSMTCIDCHQGIAHNLPEGYLEKYQEVVEELASADAPVGTSIATEASTLRTFLAYLGD